MEENSPLWFALREAGRRILSLGEISIEIPQQFHERWNRLILNISDALPQRITFPSLLIGEQLVVKDLENQIIMTNLEVYRSYETLWLPMNTNKVLPLLEQMCSELLLAGYPGCEGGGCRETEDVGDEKLSRNNLQQFSD